MNNKYISKQDIIKSVKIIDIADEFGIKIEPASSGNFDCRCTCPSLEHKNGHERTSSCYIDSKNNNFHCFGCNAGSNTIDFYMLCAEVDFSAAMEALKPKAKQGSGGNKKYISEISNFYILLKISALFRRTMLKHPKDLVWINKLMMNSDVHILNMNSSDIKTAEELYYYIDNMIKIRYGNK